MKRVNKVTLISQAHSTDEIGQPTTVETASSVICTVLEVTRAEWVAAQQKSLSPSACLSVFFRDFQGQKLAEYEGRRYEIYRTYQKGDYVELYLAERVGVINAAAT